MPTTTNTVKLNRLWRQANRAKGLCACGHQPDEGYKTCRKCLDKGKEYTKRYYTKAQAKWKRAWRRRKPGYREYYRTKTRESQLRLKKEVFDAYGNKCACPPCGETISEFLQIDHISGDGGKHRREVLGGKNRGGHAFYLWLKQNGFPKDNFQILCSNCNFAKGRYGVCPHVREHAAS